MGNVYASVNQIGMSEMDFVFESKPRLTPARSRNISHLHKTLRSHHRASVRIVTWNYLETCQGVNLERVHAARDVTERPEVPRGRNASGLLSPGRQSSDKSGAEPNLLLNRTTHPLNTRLRPPSYSCQRHHRTSQSQLVEPLVGGGETITVKQANVENIFPSHGTPQPQAYTQGLESITSGSEGYCLVLPLMDGEKGSEETTCWSSEDLD